MPPARKQPVRAPKSKRPALDPWCAWVEVLVDCVEGQGSEVGAPPSQDAQLARAAQRFLLDETEAALLGLLGVAERDLGISRKLRSLAGGPRITVEVVRELLAAASLGAIAERLLPDRALRRHALVLVDGADDRPTAASDPIRIEVGLVPVLRTHNAGLAWIEAGAGEPSALVRRITSAVPQVVALDRGDDEALAHELAAGLHRPIVRWRCREAQRPDALARLRRDIALADAALLLIEPSATQLATLSAAPAPGPGSAPLIVCMGGTVEDVAAPWVLRRDKAPAESRAAGSELDYIRQLAQRDAERALGITRPEPLPQRPVVPGRIVDASVRIAEAPAVVSETAQSPEPTLSPPPSPPPSASPSPSPPPSASPPPPPSASASPPPSPPIVDDQPRLELPPDADPDLLARAAMQSPSAAQRAEILERLAGVKSPGFVAALRHNVRSEHPALREVAERLMAQLFGPAWNRSRPIQPPVQPPPSDEAKGD